MTMEMFRGMLLLRGGMKGKTKLVGSTGRMKSMRVVMIRVR